MSPPVRSGINPTHSVDSLGCLDLKNPGSPHSDFLELMLGGPGFVILVLPCADIPTSLRFLYSRSEHIPDAPFYLLLPCSESFSSHQQGQIRPYIPKMHLCATFQVGDLISIGDYDPFYLRDKPCRLYSSLPAHYVPVILNMQAAPSPVEFQCTVPGTVGGINTPILLDTGSQISVVTRAFLQTHAISFQSRPFTIFGVNGSLSTSYGNVLLQVALQYGSRNINFTVVDEIPTNISALLGLDFFISSGLIADFSNPGQLKLTVGSGDLRETFIRPFQTTNSLPRCSFSSVLPISADTPTGDSTCSIGIRETRRFLRDSQANSSPVFTLLLSEVSPSSNSAPSVMAIATPVPTFLDTVIAKHKDHCLRDEPPDGAHDKGHSFPIDLLPGAQPKAHRQYRLTPAERDELDKQVQKLISKSWIRPSSSAWAAPVLFAPKPGGKLRLCIDYRYLNNCTVKNCYPLPRIDEIFDSLKHPMYFTALDLASGYHQFPVNERDRHKTAFRTSNGLYEWKVMPFGLANAPSIFQNAMNTILKVHIAAGYCLVYLDDILIFSPSMKDHILHVDAVLATLDSASLYCQPAKCLWAQTELKYLGHIISAKGLQPDPSKVAVVKDWPRPLDKGQLRSFLGLTNYFKKFIPHYSTLAAPLTHLTKDIPYEWTSSQDSAFTALKACLINAPTLAIPDDSLTFQVYTDASISGVGGVLIQDGRPLAYCGRKLIPAEVNYSTTEQELLAIVYATQQWRHYLEGPQWQLHTDHQPLVWIRTQPSLSRRQTRWLEWLSRFHIEFCYIPGKQNVLADALSRATHLPSTQDAPLHDGNPPTLLCMTSLPFHQRYWSRPVCLIGGLTRGSVARAQTPTVVPLPSSSCALPPLTIEPLAPSVQRAPLTPELLKELRLFARNPTAAPLPPLTAVPSVQSVPDPLPVERIPLNPEQLKALRLSARNPAAEPLNLSSAPLTNEPLDVCPAPSMTLPEQSELIHKRDTLVDNFFRLTAEGYLHDPWFANSQHTDKLSKRDAYYFKNDALVLPKYDHLRESILFMHHDAPWAAHLGQSRTKALIAESFWWPGMCADVDDYVASCGSCQRNKSKNISGESFMAPLPVPWACWRTVGFDLIPNLPRTLTGYDCICHFMCHLSKMSRLVACNVTLTSEGFAHMYVREIFPHYGFPTAVVSDRGSQWNSKFWNSLCDICDIKQRMSSSFRPQTDGLVERTNRVVEEAIRHFVSPLHDDWDNSLPFLEFALNSARHESTGCSAFELNRISRPLAPLQAMLALQNRIPSAKQFAVRSHLQFQRAHELVHAAKNRMKQLADSKRKLRTFTAGDQVLLSTKNLKLFKSVRRKKFMPRFLGPLTIIEPIGVNAYKLKLPGSMVRVHDVFHVSLLFPYRANSRMQMPAPLTAEGFDNFEVDAVMDHRDLSDKSREYLVTWRGYPASENSWEPEHALSAALEAVQAYQVRHNLPLRDPVPLSLDDA